MMWPFTRKVVKAVEMPHDPTPMVQAMAEDISASRNERSDTVAAFVRKMRDLRFEIEIAPDLSGRHNDGRGHAD